MASVPTVYRFSVGTFAMMAVAQDRPTRTDNVGQCSGGSRGEARYNTEQCDMQAIHDRNGVRLMFGPERPVSPVAQVQQSFLQQVVDERKKG